MWKWDILVYGLEIYLSLFRNSVYTIPHRVIYYSILPYLQVVGIFDGWWRLKCLDRYQKHRTTLPNSLVSLFTHSRINLCVGVNRPSWPRVLRMKWSLRDLISFPVNTHFILVVFIGFIVYFMKMAYSVNWLQCRITPSSTCGTVVPYKGYLQYVLRGNTTAEAMWDLLFVNTNVE